MAAKKQSESDECRASAVNLRKADWKLLRRVAEARAERDGGRPSVSAVLQRLIDENRPSLRRESKLAE